MNNIVELRRNSTLKC